MSATVRDLRRTQPAPTSPCRQCGAPRLHHDELCERCSLWRAIQATSEHLTMLLRRARELAR